MNEHSERDAVLAIQIFSIRILNFKELHMAGNKNKLQVENE